jgi:predicted nucleic acid-binding Zn ribbon protein
MDGTGQIHNSATVSCGAKLERCAAGVRTRRGLKEAVRLGDVAGKLMEQLVSPRQGRFELVARVWDQLLPAELGRHCAVADISGGQLKVLVDSPVYMHELRLCSPELLEQLRRRCPQARIERIKLSIG